MSDLSKRTARELLTTRVSGLLNTDYGVFSIRSYLPSRLASLIDAVIGRDERLTEKLEEIDAWRDKWIYELPLRATTELDKIFGDAP